MFNNNLEVNDIVTLKKSHPSGTKEWKVLKVKPTVKLQSTLTPSLIIELKRDKATKAIKEIKKPQE